MQRSKQQALFFLLGAVLVGGVFGFTAKELFDPKATPWTSRARMYDAIILNEEQRQQMDSLLDERNCQLSAVMKPVRPQLDSIKNEANRQMLQILTPRQQTLLEERRREMAVRDSVEKVRRDSVRAANKMTVTCVN
jgi:Spy/CpxP family protein refolding chaperone